MTRSACACLVVLAVGLSAPAVLGQLPAPPALHNTLTVVVTGSAESAPDWAEVNISVEGRGAAAAEAILKCQEAYEGSMRELAKVGVDPKSIRCTAPRLTGVGLAAMVAAAQGTGKADKFVAVRTLTVRLDKIRPDSLYDDVGKIIDAAVAGGAAGPAEAQPWSGMIPTSEIVTFGVNDPKALRAKAIADGLAQARELAEAIAAAEQPRRAIQGITILVVQQPDSQGPMAAATAMATLLAPPEAGKAVSRVSMSVTFQIE